MPRSTAVTMLIAAMALTGANVPIGKIIVAEFPVALFLSFRFAVATAVLAMLAFNEPGPRLKSMSKADWRDLLVLSLVGSVAFTIFTMEGVKRTSGADAGIILASLPAVAAGMGMLVRGERLSGGQSAAIALAVAGLATIGIASRSGPPGAPWGNLLIVAAVLCEATFVLASGRISRIYRPIRLSLGVSAASLLASLPLTLQALANSPVPAIDLTVWGLALWYALASSIFCTVLWYKGAAHVETWLAGLATAAVPVAALGVSWFWLGEQIGLDRVLGAGLVLAGIVAGALARQIRPSR